MQIETKILKELAKVAASAKNCRPHISMVRLDAYHGKARLWATDGHCLVTYTLDAPAPEMGTSYNLNHIKKLTKNDVIYLEGSTLTDNRGQLPIADDQSAPDIDAVIPGLVDEECGSPKFFSVNPALVSKVLGVVSKMESPGLVGGRFQLGLDAMSPIRFDYGSCMAVIMPCREH